MPAKTLQQHTERTDGAPSKISHAACDFMDDYAVAFESKLYRLGGLGPEVNFMHDGSPFNRMRTGRLHPCCTATWDYNLTRSINKPTGSDAVQAFSFRIDDTQRTLR